jgi:anti-sigma regulatory factor (Ser/Thr protein kinase)
VPYATPCRTIREPADDMRLGSLRLPMRPESVAAARRFVVGVARAWDVTDDVTEIAELLTSEIVTNGVVHPKCSPAAVIEVSAIRAGECLIVECHDPSQEPPKVLGVADPLREQGRGMDLLRDLSYDCGVHLTEGSGKSVWFELLAWRLSD